VAVSLAIADLSFGSEWYAFEISLQEAPLETEDGKHAHLIISLGLICAEVPHLAEEVLAVRRVSTTLRQSAKEFSEYSFLENPMRRVC
jgi:hypothetical protein